MKIEFLNSELLESFTKKRFMFEDRSFKQQNIFMFSLCQYIFKIKKKLENLPITGGRLQKI